MFRVSGFCSSIVPPNTHQHSGSIIRFQSIHSIYKPNNSFNERPKVLMLLYACFWMYISLWITYDNLPSNALPITAILSPHPRTFGHSIRSCLNLSDAMHAVSCAPRMDSTYIHVRGPLTSLVRRQKAIRRYCSGRYQVYKGVTKERLKVERIQSHIRNETRWNEVASTSRAKEWVEQTQVRTG